MAQLKLDYGENSSEEKLKNFIDLDDKSPSIFSFHNRFLEQIRTAFVMGSYYPALTAACALGERVLNHLILLLREDFKSTPEYKAIYRKDSFDDWNLAINTLEAWKVLLPDAAREFRSLRDRRNDSIHFRPEVDRNGRALALDAIHNLSAILSNQFSAFGPQPWFITGVPGEMYLKKDWESHPFVRKVYIPNCVAVGPKHTIESVMPWVVNDNFDYELKEITDEKFCSQRRATNERQVREIKAAARTDRNL